MVNKILAYDFPDLEPEAQEKAVKKYRETYIKHAFKDSITEIVNRFAESIGYPSGFTIETDIDTLHIDYGMRFPANIQDSKIPESGPELYAYMDKMKNMLPDDLPYRQELISIIEKEKKIKNQGDAAFIYRLIMLTGNSQRVGGYLDYIDREYRDIISNPEKLLSVMNGTVKCNIITPEDFGKFAVDGTFLLSAQEWKEISSL